MTNTSRRAFVKALAATPFVMGSWKLAAATGTVPSRDAADAHFKVREHAAGVRVPTSLCGLSYETLQLVNDDYFLAGNTQLVRLFRKLNPDGILRIGGNTSDYTVWSGYRGDLRRESTRDGGPRQQYVLHPAALGHLAGFLEATGWRLIFGLNLRIGNPAMAADLASAVRDAVGGRLVGVQIGNEADAHYEKDFREYNKAWQSYARLLHARGIPIGGPDSSDGKQSTGWVIDYARQDGSASKFLSRHYYIGPAEKGTMQQMLTTDVAFDRSVDRIVAVADKVGLPFFITEANSFYHGGRQGVSNVFASALWGADFLLDMAARGVANVDFHGGTLASVAASLGRDGMVDGAVDLRARRDAITSRYSPIAGDARTGFARHPLYHGLRIAQRFAGAQMLAGDLDAGAANVTAYAARRGDMRLVTIINKDARRDVDMRVDGLPGNAPAAVARLTAPALGSRRRIDVGLRERIHTDAAGACRLAVPHGSIAMVRITGHASRGASAHDGRPDRG